MKFHILKVCWGIRALIYKIVFRRIKFPSYLGRPLFISGGKHIKIGKKVRIFPNLRMEVMQNGFIEIKDNTYIGQNCHITSAAGPLIIEKNVSIMANVCITNINHIYDKSQNSVLEQGIFTKKTSIGEGCFIGHGAIILPGAKLGDHVIVGANSVVTSGEIPSYCVVAGIPAKIIKHYSVK